VVHGSRAGPRSRYWIGRARVGRAWAAFIGIVGDNASHSHHAIQGFSGRRVFVQDGAQEARVGDGFVLPPDFAHRATAADEAAFLYVDPDTLAGRAIALRLRDSVWALAPAEAVAFRAIVQDAITAGDDAGPADALADLLGAPREQASRADPRIASLIERISTSHDLPDDAGAAAASVGLSESRLVHLFSHEVGVPWRTFLLWTKLRRAIEAVAAGATLTAAAHVGGFADSAHFSRTCRVMFGISPHAMTRGLAFR